MNLPRRRWDVGPPQNTNAPCGLVELATFSEMTSTEDGARRIRGNSY